MAKIYDESILDSATGNLELSVDVSEDYNIKNPDGSSPNATVKIEAETLRIAATALTTLHNDNEAEAMIMGEAADKLSEIDEEFLIMATDDNVDMDELMKRVVDFASTNQDWATAQFKMGIDVEGDEYDIIISITAPGYKSMVKSLNTVTSPNAISATISAFMPDDGSEDEDYSDYDLAE